MPRLTRRSLALTLLATPAIAQGNLPDRPIRLVAPFAAGGASDLISRMMADELGTSLGQQVVVENRAGAGGAIGTEAVVRARPDGTTLLMGSQATHSTNPALYRLSYDPGTDLLPLAGVAGVPGVLVVGPASTARTLQDFIAGARAAPGRFTYGSAGNGASTHLTMALLEHMAGIELQHVPYRGTGPALQDLLGGRIMALFDTLPTSLPHIREGRLRALAVSTVARNATLPEVPTVAEAALPGYEALNWYAVFGPRGLPDAMVAALHQGLDAGVRRPSFQGRLAAQGMDPMGGTPAELAAYIAADRRRWTDLVRAANITVN
ncbi:Bug family tripartite tricarboxylate transporter substrate binding protein [Neoroseomonas rubea]|uniref:Bug family tripartite tricarboxylate transporter substrate binding protein n=1 Tax=Neoroseomonas rubea TaxID=2748666 RepID=UPI0018DF907E|nr:tripartite tricarboxylate transporter substrate binding protein [Roseomonas rubea]